VAKGKQKIWKKGSERFKGTNINEQYNDNTRNNCEQIIVKSIGTPAVNVNVTNAIGCIKVNNLKKTIK